MKTVRIFALLMATAALVGCAEEPKTWVNQDRVEVHQDHFTDSFETAKLDDGMLRAIGVYYYRYGNGPMDAVVSYDPRSKVNTAAKAQAEMLRIERALRAGGVKDLRITKTAAAGSGDASTTMVNFEALTARAPEKCGLMPGLEGPNALEPNGNDDPAYRFGCSIETMMARQVSRPADLLGKHGFETNSDARRQDKVLSGRGYYGDKAADKLEGETASEN